MNNTRIFTIFIVAAYLVSFSSLSKAQDGAVIDEIVVTAQRREQNLRDVPISISVFTSDQIKQHMLYDVADYFAMTPNVAASAQRARHRRIISIRGVSNLGGETDAFGFYIDEFNVAVATNNPQINDIERIEILRGPQGTFFGRNATGGAISLITNKPGPEFYAEGLVGIGDYDTYEAEGVVNIPLVEDKFLARVSGRWTQTDGFIENVNPNGGGEQSEYWNVRGALRFVPTERLTMDLTAMAMRENDQLEIGVATHVMFDPDTVDLAFASGPAPITDGLAPFPTNQDTINRDVSLNQDYDYEIFVGRIEYAFNNYSLTSITGNIDAELRELGDGEQTSLDWVTQSRMEEFETFSSELRFATIGERKLDWLVGALYAEDTHDRVFDFTTGTDTAVFIPFAPFCFVNPPDCFIFPAVDFLIFQDQFVVDTTSWAVFADATWHVNEKLDLSLGGRYSDDEIEKQQTAVNFGTPEDFGTGKESFDDFSPRFAALYAWTDNVNFYGLVSKGYKAGGLQLELLPSGQIFPSVFDEETLWNYEVGMKSLFFDNRLRLDLSVFYMDWTDIQVTNRQQLTDPATGNFVVLDVTQNATGAKSSGVELDFDWRATDALSFNGSIGYLDTEFDDFANSGVEDLNGNVVDLTGSEMLLAPEWTINMNGEYRRRIFGNSEGFIRAEFFYRDTTKPKIFNRIDALARNDPFVDGSPGSPFETPAYDVWNFRAGIESDRYKVVAYIENAFDELYWTGAFESVSFSGIQLQPNPRMYGIRLAVNTK
jgi:iron complex outermembrane receptor protein